MMGLDGGAFLLLLGLAQEMSCLNIVYDLVGKICAGDFIVISRFVHCLMEMWLKLVKSLI